ncbi:nitroreductase [Coprinopsis cinerea okayama7|uniref:Nitroreductase n=1 Tax=Coprinopsis cinerea (strain Okayama-7 / 130 / ATCC MYA-4618 / FGSC 9003) TaxID=240176 RepID=A8N9J0_COPC7|nr:nitroreductase [Coprinopsis cinerea okayama7\|eukprot:XP_001831496.1 nitroreductase [Coprinopsis cinerea okayama7\
MASPQVLEIIGKPTSLPPIPDSVLDTQMTVADSLMKGRFSCRFYLDKEVPKDVIESIVDTARFSPSGNNMQPWERVYCITGQRLLAVQDDMLAAFMENATTGAHKSGYNYYPLLDILPERHAKRREDAGQVIGKVLGIERTDVAERARVAGRNYQFYGAPVALVFTISSKLEKGSWIDLGYFLQSVTIAARSRGLETCSQESISTYHQVLRKHVPISDDEIVAVGMSVGYPDLDLIQRFPFIQARREVSDILEFHD